MKNKKLVIFVPSIEDGGVEKNLFLISNFLANKNISVNLITANRDKKKNFSKKVNFICPNSASLNKKNRFYKTIYCFFLLFNFYLRNRNILIMSFQANIYAIFFASCFNIDIITRSNTAPQGWSSNPLKRYIFKVFFRYPKKIIVNSLDFKKDLDKEFKIKSTCIYNPFNDKIVKTKSQEKILFKLFNKKKESINIINIGRMTDQKDQILILKALNNLKNKIKFKCLILGKGTNKLKLDNFIINNKLKDQIKLSGFKFNPYPYMKMTNLFILSSRYEGLPNVLLEAQYLEKFIISTNCPTGPREILLDGKAGKLIKVGNQGQLEKAILYYYNNRNSSEVNNKIRFGKKNMKRFDFKINCYKYYMVIKKYI